MMKENTNTTTQRVADATATPKTKVIKKTETIKVSTKKSILIKAAFFQFLGLLALAIAIIIIIAIVINNNKTTTNADTTTTTNTATAETREVIIEKPVEVEVIKEVEVIDQEAVEALADEKATLMFEELKASYTAQADEAATIEQVNALYEELKAAYIAQADAAEVTRQTLEKFEAFKEAYIAEQEAARLADVSTISIYVYGAQEFYLEIQGSLYTELTYDMIKANLLADPRMEGYKINRIANPYAVELFCGRDFNSTRNIRIEKI